MADNSNSGRPSTYTPELAAQICEIIGEGSHMAEACRRLDISRSTVNRWERSDPEFREAVRQARIEGAWALYDQVFDIGEEVVGDNANASRQRERLRIRMWALSKMLPAVFGEKLQVDVTQKIDLDAAMAAASARLARRGHAALDISDAEIIQPLKLAINEQLLS